MPWYEALHGASHQMLWSVLRGHLPALERFGVVSLAYRRHYLTDMGPKADVFLRIGVVFGSGRQPEGDVRDALPQPLRAVAVDFLRRFNVWPLFVGFSPESAELRDYTTTGTLVSVPEAPPMPAIYSREATGPVRRRDESHEQAVTAPPKPQEPDPSTPDPRQRSLFG